MTLTYNCVLCELSLEIMKSQEALVNTVGSCKCTPPPFRMLASGKTGEGAYVQDCDISA